MKQSDIITVVIIAVVGTIAAYFGVNMLLGNPADATYQFKIIEGISADLASPDPEVFNKDAINPTIEVYVGDCQDVDQNGIIDKAELVNCGKLDVSELEKEKQDEEEDTEPEEDTTQSKKEDDDAEEED
ncbi:hypothetical protein IJI55_02265 [Candidatus Saccharibacteria bacterium]|nr:hypothetical protein [Candidatus Saccharibacteria bacterium]